MIPERASGKRKWGGRRPRDLRRWLITLVLLVLGSGLLFGAGTVALVLLLRGVPPPTSAFMLGSRFEDLHIGVKILSEIYFGM